MPNSKKLDRYNELLPIATKYSNEFFRKKNNWPHTHKWSIEIEFDILNTNITIAKFK